MSTVSILGIDIAKDKFDAELLLEERTYRRTFRNQPADFEKVTAWLRKLSGTPVHACLEATGTYGEALALYLHAQGHTVSIVNPAQIKAFGRSELVRAKTDKIDAGLIARFCQSQRPAPWTPPDPAVRELRDLVRRLEDLQGMLNQEQNRLTSGTLAEPVHTSLLASIAFLKEQIKQLRQQIHDHFDAHPELAQQRDLITSIDGLGELTAAKLIAEFLDLRRFRGARQLAAQSGLTPKPNESGSSVHGHTPLSKMGPAQIRKALYMPAVVALRCNPVIQALAERLAQRGKCKMVILGAAMRKLLHLVYGVLKSGRPFDPHYSPLRA